MTSTTIDTPLPNSSVASEKTEAAIDAAAPRADSGVTGKHRWLICTVKNETKFRITLEGSFFASGRYWDVPNPIAAHAPMVFSVCNGDDTFLTGVSGGTAFKVESGTSSSFPFAIGWTNPELGSFKAGVAASSSAQAGYNAASENGGSIDSPVYKRTSESGESVGYKLHISAAPGQRPAYVISEIRSP